MSETFSHHEACPTCGSRDNVGVWTDGHKYCFGCGWKDGGTKTIKALQDKIYKDNSITTNGLPFDTDTICSHLPASPLKWLLKYGISPLEIKHYRIGWSELRSSLVFPVVVKDEIVLTNERYFGADKDHPKYKTYGTRNNTVFVTRPKEGTSPKTVIFVEDFVSAIKVGRSFAAVPLFGTTIPAKAIKWASGEFKQARVWLDMDKATKSLQEASRLSQYMSSSSIFTELDPKEYSDNDIFKYISESIEL